MRWRGRGAAIPTELLPIRRCLGDDLLPYCLTATANGQIIYVDEGMLGVL
jgi:hypothetical protein